MKRYLQYLSTEFIKIKGSFAWWLILAGAAFIPVFVAFVFLSKWQHLIPAPGHNPWDDYTEMTWKGMGFLFTPFFIVLLVCLYLNIEHKSNTWKHLFTLPVAKGKIFVGKLLALLVFLLVFYVLYVAIWIACGFLVGFIKPALQLTEYSPNYLQLLSLSFHSYISSLGILALHYWLSLRFRNMIIPIGIAVICGIVWVAMYQGRAAEIVYFPYAYHYSTVSPPDWVAPKFYGPLAEHELLSIVYFLLFGVVGYWYFTRSFKG